MESTTPQTGYLHQDFRLFHLKDQKKIDFEFHYHDFHKIIILLSGDVTYLVEGKSYILKPMDVLLVNHHAIHKPIIQTDRPYERIVIWLKNDFIEQQHHAQVDLSACFQYADERRFNLIRLDHMLQQQISTLLQQLESALISTDFGSSVLGDTYFLQLMVYLNRIFLQNDPTKKEQSCHYDEQMDQLLQYINQNLNADLSNEALADLFYLNKYHLMHKFKNTTGYTLHNYVQQKRLIHAASLIKSGVPITQAALDSGFSDYSTFLRAFRKMFHLSPKELLKDAHSFQ